MGKAVHRSGKEDAAVRNRLSHGKRQVVVWGASGHALVVADIIRLRGQYELVGFLDDVSLECRDGEFYGIPILRGRKELDRLVHSYLIVRHA